MLRNDLVADLFTQYFNEAGKEFDKVFEIYDSATDYKIVKPLSIVGILSETGGSVKPVMNYVNTTCNYEIGLLYSVEAGFGEIKKMNEIMENVIKALNGVPLQLSGGQALITFNQQHTGDYEIHRPQIGKSVIPKLAFKVEYSQQQDGLRYEMALIDTPFDMTTQDTRYFSSQSEQQTYYLNKVQESGVPFCEMMAPNVNSLTLQQQVYINDLRYYPEGTENVKELNEILQKNYAVIRAMDGETAKAYYYYWVQNATVGDNNQALLDLKMDTIQTWHFNSNLEYADCMIHKAHLNRWIDNGDGTVSFDGTVNSKLFEREDIQNVAKRLVKRTKLNLYSSFPNDLAEALDECIYGWLYYFVDNKHKYNVVTLNTTHAEDATDSFYSIYHEIYDLGINYDIIPNMYLPDNIAVLTVPIYKNTSSKRIKIDIKDLGVFKFDYVDGLRPLFETREDSYDYLYQIKFSTLPPFDFSYVPTYNIDSNGDIIFKVKDIYEGITMAGDDKLPNLYFFSSAVGAVFTNVRYQRNTISLNYESSQNYKFNISNIISSSKSSEYNPKLLSLDYKSFTISNELNDSFDYDFQLINNKNIKLTYNESLTPDINKQYLRLHPPENNIYAQELSQKLYGMISSNDNSIGFITDNYKSMLANQKNYFIQNDINRKFSLGTGLLQGISGALSPLSNTNSLSGVNQTLWSSGQTIWSSNINFIQSKINQDLIIDNIKNAPNIIETAKGNVFFESAYSLAGLYAEEWELYENEKRMINDYMDMFGFTYNQVNNIKNVDNLRHYHNYVEAEVTTISGVSVSNAIREDIKSRFNQGVRFWNSDNIQYDMENYENWLTD